MSGRYAFIGIGILLLSGTFALAQSSPLDIRQVPDKPKSPRTVGEKEAGLSPEDDQKATQQDHQSSVLNNPVISDYGRTKAYTHFNGNGGGNSVNVQQYETSQPKDESELGGNTVIIEQEGGNNKSIVIQKGQDNYASQRQEGHSNKLYLEQEGQNNSSTEVQKGNHNRKTKIQNGTSEIIIDQVDSE